MGDQDTEIDGTGPTLSLKVHGTDVRVIVDVRNKEQRGGDKGGEHEDAMGGHASRLDGYNRFRSASTPYVRGFMYIRSRIQLEAPASGNNAPESSQRGIRNRLIIA